MSAPSGTIGSAPAQWPRSARELHLDIAVAGITNQSAANAPWRRYRAGGQGLGRRGGPLSIWAARWRHGERATIGAGIRRRDAWRARVSGKQVWLGDGRNSRRSETGRDHDGQTEATNTVWRIHRVNRKLAHVAGRKVESMTNRAMRMSKRASRIAGSMLALAMLSACATATPYQPNIAVQPGRPVPGGFSEQRIEPERYRVSFAGNSLTSRETVESYLLYRAAELTQAQGFDWFTIADRRSPDRPEGTRLCPDRPLL